MSVLFTWGGLQVFYWNNCYSVDTVDPFSFLFCGSSLCSSSLVCWGRPLAMLRGRTVPPAQHSICIMLGSQILPKVLLGHFLHKIWPYLYHCPSVSLYEMEALELLIMSMVLVTPGSWAPYLRVGVSDLCGPFHLRITCESANLCCTVENNINFHICSKLWHLWRDDE